MTHCNGIVLRLSRTPQDADFTDGGSDRLIDMLVAWGDETALKDRLSAYENAGASSVTVLPIGGLDPVETPVLALLSE